MRKPNPNWKAEADEAYRETAPTPLQEFAAAKDQLIGKIIDQAAKDLKGFARAVKMMKGPRGIRRKKIRWVK